jgi:ribosomal protein L37AE/L43A
MARKAKVKDMTYMNRKNAGLCPRCASRTVRPTRTRTVHCAPCVKLVSGFYVARRKGKAVSTSLHK